MAGDIPISADRWNGGTATKSGSREADELICAKQSQFADRHYVKQTQFWRGLIEDKFRSEKEL